MFSKPWETIGCLYRKPSHVGDYYALKCDNYKTLVAASSIIRPGRQSGMMKEYIFRHNHPDRSSIFMMFLGTTGETYGVMVYQEDVIKIVLHYAGSLPTGYFASAMSGKGRSKQLYKK
jgi:DNA polymerase-3 subunit alpha/error-prone DNA polymerase